MDKRLTALEFVKSYCEKNAVQINYDRTISINGKRGDLKRLRNALILLNHELQLKYPAEVLTVAVDEHLQSVDEGILEAHRRSLAFNPTGTDTALRTWLLAVTGKEDELDVVALKHFIWQVKRKLSGKPVAYHMMPVVCGATGSGKSVAVEKLLRPLRAISECGTDCSIFEDDRKWRVFHRAYVISFEEMSKAAQTDVNGMKKAITADVISYRLLGTHDYVTAPMVSTFIGTSNNYVNEVILDSTSARRFWQISSLPKVDWAAVNELDAVAIWQCVDEASDEAPVKTAWSQIQTKQHEEFRHKSPIEEWFADGWRVTAEDKEFTKAGLAFQSFRGWAEVNNHGKLISSTRFGLELKKLAGVAKVRKQDGVYYTVAPLNPAAVEANGNVVTADFVRKKLDKGKPGD